MVLCHVSSVEQGFVYQNCEGFHLYIGHMLVEGYCVSQSIIFLYFECPIPSCRPTKSVNGWWSKRFKQASFSLERCKTTFVSFKAHEALPVPAEPPYSDCNKTAQVKQLVRADHIGLVDQKSH